jgi:hypothetical protein
VSCCATASDACTAEHRGGATDRLAAYWAEALGGPELFTGRYGDETAVVRMHSGNGEHDVPDGLQIPQWSWDGLVTSSR